MSLTSDDVQRAKIPLGGLRSIAAAGTRTGNRYPANFDVLHLDPGGHDNATVAVVRVDRAV